MAEINGKKYGCEACIYFHDDSEIGDYGTVYSVSYLCTKKEYMANLKQFPFENAPVKCFRLGFWHSEFADRVNGEEVNDNAAWNAYDEWRRQHYPQDYIESTESA